MNAPANDGGRPEQDIAGKVGEAGRELKARASELAGQFGETAKQQTSEMGSTARRFASDAANTAQAAIDEQRSLGAQYVESVAGAMHRAAGEFDREIPVASKYLHQTAEQIESAARMVRDRNVRELVGEVEGFARRQPALFFGGAMLLGFAALRFLKSAPEGSGGGSRSSSDTSPPRVSSPSMSEFDDELRPHTHEGA